MGSGELRISPGRSMRPITVIESPYAGPDRILRVRYARAAMRDSLLRGEAPVASHLLYTQILEDENPIQREIGIVAGLAFHHRADLVAFYVDLGWSSGMETARHHLLELQRQDPGRAIRVERRTIPEALEQIRDRVWP